MNIAVIQSPGSNCDQDALYALRNQFGAEAKYVWHDARSLNGFDAVVIPGGFTYGDYLRGGAIASRATIMNEVVRFANEGRLVLGICNGFQILTELGLLPGALIRNGGLRFVCKKVQIAAVNKTSPWTKNVDRVLTVPVAHNEGRYVADETTLEALRRQNRIAFRYCDPSGNFTPESNPNGSADSIAGVLNEQGNVLGMMPHPERAVDTLLGGEDGRLILGCLVGA
jgi:phosphoribosylformylglycinamidine synthase